jgi:phosphoribosylamine--glycine ligase
MQEFLLHIAFTCSSKEEIEIALDAFDAPYVVKDDGLAAGKGCCCHQ